MHLPNSPEHALLRLALALAAAALTLCAPAAARAQDGPRVISARLITDRPAGAPFVAVSFSKQFDPAPGAPQMNPDSYRLARISRGADKRDRFLDIERVTRDPDETDVATITSVRLYLDTPLDMNDGDRLTVYYIADTFDGKELEAPLISAVKAEKPTAATPPPPPAGDKPRRAEDAGGFKFKKAKGREDAHVYFSGDLNRASGTDFTGSIDLKVELPLPVLRSPRHEVAPFLDVLASNDPESDPDTIKVGAESKLIVAQAGLEYSEDSPVAGVAWYNAGKIEGDRDFDNINAIFSSRFLFPLKPVFFTRQKKDRAFFELTPFLGLEAGKNLESQVAEAEGRGLARVLVGSQLYARLYQGGESFARVTLDGVYERRWPLLAEVGFRDTTVEVLNGKDETVQVPAFYGKGPREWAEANLNYNFNAFFSAFAGYQYGEQPPAYKLVDHSFRFGLVVKARVK